ncbi:MAG TPA: tetraacyldisaccharide 4'-kinase [Methylophilaceae bacterium]
MDIWLQKQWYRISIWHIFLWPVSIIFGLILAIRRLCYGLKLFKATRLPVPVIVVGNLTVGGTGKTPLVIWLAQFLRTQGYTPCVISRGYGGSAPEPQAVSSATDPSLVGDEAVLLARRLRCPVWVGADRVAVARALLSARPDCNVILSDDGMQHYRLQRDIEIAVVDGHRRFGNGLLLPAGPMREPQARLQCVDAVVINGGETHADEYAMQLTGNDFYNLQDLTSSVPASYFLGKKVHAVAGIGHPARFFNHLRKLGLQIEEHAFPDHHPYQPRDLQFEQAEAILMTEKDAVKCTNFNIPNIWFLPVTGGLPSAFGDRILQQLKAIENGRKTA